MFRPIAVLLALGLAAGPAHAQEREWMLDASEEDAYLIFGVPDSDDVGVSFWCPIGKDVVNLYVPVPARLVAKNREKATPLTVTAGEETSTIRGKVDVNPEAALASIEAEMAVDHPLVGALLKADRFRVRVSDEDIVFPLYDAYLDELLALCRKSKG